MHTLLILAFASLAGAFAYAAFTSLRDARDIASMWIVVRRQAERTLKSLRATHHARAKRAATYAAARWFGADHDTARALAA